LKKEDRGWRGGRRGGEVDGEVDGEVGGDGGGRSGWRWRRERWVEMAEGEVVSIDLY
jgi:hypothetical protein